MDKPEPLKPKSRHTRAQLKAQLEGLKQTKPNEETKTRGAVAELKERLAGAVR